MERATITLTPAMAQSFLDKTDDRQRKINMMEANKIARDIKDGRWVYSPFDAIGISVDGKLMDGQHRCLGVVIADKPVTTDILYNVPLELFYRLDQSKPRKVKDFMFCKNYNTVAGLAKFAYCIESGALVSQAINGRIKDARIDGKRYKETPSNQEILDYFEKNEDELAYIAELGCKAYRELRIVGKTLFADAFWLSLYLNKNLDLELISMFVDELCMPTPTSENLSWLKASFIKDAYRAKLKHHAIDRTHAFYTVLAMIDGYANNTEAKNSVPRYVKTIEKKYNAMVETKRGKLNATN